MLFDNKTYTLLNNLLQKYNIIKLVTTIKTLETNTMFFSLLYKIFAKKNIFI